MPRELELDTDSTENINKKALQVLQRVSTKLRGRDYYNYNDNNKNNNYNDNDNEENEVTNVKEQVQRLFIEATHHENLSQAYLGCVLYGD